MTTNVEQFLSDLDGGVFQEKLSRTLSDVAAHVMDFEKKGQVTLTFDVKRSGSSQVNITHKLAYKHPPSEGKKAKTTPPQHPCTLAVAA